MHDHDSSLPKLQIRGTWMYRMTIVVLIFGMEPVPKIFESHHWVYYNIKCTWKYSCRIPVTNWLQGTQVAVKYKKQRCGIKMGIGRILIVVVIFMMNTLIAGNFSK